MTEINQQLTQIDYLQITELVTHYHMDISPSEAHGLITASVCTVSQNPVEDSWVKLLIPFDNIIEHQQGHLTDALKVIFSLTEHTLNNGMFDFAPVLPDDDASSDFRINELAAWCRGFMVAYEHFLLYPEKLSAQAKEVIADFAEIAFAEIGDEHADDEELNNDLSELEEYLRIGVQTIFEDLNEAPVLH